MGTAKGEHEPKFRSAARIARGLDRLRSSALLPYIVLAVSLATTGLWWYVLHVQSTARARTEFENEAHQSANEIREALLGFEEVLQAGAGLLLASDTVSREEWRRFVERLGVTRTYPGIEAINYAERLQRDQIAPLEARMRADGNPDFHVWPASAHDEYVVAVLAERFSGGPDLRVLGFDLLSESTRRQAIERARDTGTITLSGRVNLLGNSASANQPALLMLLPVYRSDSTPTSVEDRRRTLRGYVSAAFRLNDLVAAALSSKALPLAVAIQEGKSATPEAITYANAGGQQMLAGRHARMFTVDVPLSLSGQVWTLRFGVNRASTVGLQGTDPLVALGTGISVSLFLFAIAWSESALRARATKLAKEMTQAARERAELLNLTHDMVFLRDRTNIIRYWNRAASDTYGYSADEAIGRTADDLLKTRFPIPLATLWEELTRHDRWEGEIVHTRRDGTELLVASRWAVQRGANGEIEAVLETNNDVTERRRAEEDRRRLESSLLQAQKLEAMGTLAGGVAHDFNNILGAILGYGELAQRAAPATSALRRYVDNMMSAGLRAKSLVDRILAFSRSGVGPRVSVHVQSVVVETLELLNASLPNNIRLQCALAADDAAVFGDATQIHQVVLNLCTNAVQAMRVGGTLCVSLDVALLDAPRTVITSTLAAGPYVRLQVQDTGEGIEPALRDRVFDPFFTTKGVGVGTGLGLSLVHGIVTDLGGGVDMASELGQGTTFEVYLPHHGRADPQTADDDAVIRGAGETIMLVDDELMLVQLGEEMIAGLGYEAVGFTSAAQALEAFRVDPLRFAAVLSDETMPGMTGSQLAEQIIAIRADTPIVLLSGYAGATLAARARSVGARDVVGKPLALRDIAAVLASMVRTRA